MAGSNNSRDVSLVITAKNEASNALNAIQKAMEALGDSATGLTASGSQVNAVLDKLAQVLNRTDNAFAASGAGKYADSVTAVKAAVDRMAQASADGGDKVSKLNQQLETARAASVTAKAAFEAADAAMRKEAETTTVLKAQLTALSADLKAVSADKVKLTAESARLSAQLCETNAKLVASAERFEALRVAVKVTGGETAGQVSQFQKAGEAYYRNIFALEELQNRQTENGQATQMASGLMADLQARIGTTNGTISAQAGRLEQASTALTNLRAQATAAATAEGQLERAATRASQAVTDQKASVTAAQQQFGALKAAAEQSAVAQKELQEKQLSYFQATLNDASKSLTGVSALYRSTGTNLKSLTTQMDATESPTIRVQKAFESLSEKALAFNSVMKVRQGTFDSYTAAMDKLKSGQTSYAQTETAFADIRSKEQKQLLGLVDQYGYAASAAIKARTAVSGYAISAQALTGAQDAGARAAQDLASKVPSVQTAFDNLFGSGARVLGFTERLKAEFISLALTFGGVFGVIEGVKGISDAFVTLESAKNRLNAALGGDKSLGAEKLDMLRRSANELGLSMDVLIDEYSKFAVATKGTVLAANTDKIFLAAADAARVNKLSVDDLRRMYLALTEIVSQGQVYHRTMVNQLGTVLPGAVQIAASSLHKTTGEYERLLKAGEITSSSLVNFADELEKRFGAALPDLLKTYTTALGQLSNQAFQARLVIADAGVEQALKGITDEINKFFQSAQGKQFLEQVGAALGKLLGILGEIPGHLGLASAAVSALVSSKLMAFAIGASRSLLDLGAALRASVISFTAVKAVADTSSASLGQAAVAARGFSVVLKEFLLGPVFGAVVAAIGAGIGYWSTTTDEATEAIARHKRIVDEIKGAYDRAGEGPAKFSETVKGLTASQAQQNFDAQAKLYRNQLATIMEGVKDQAGPAWSGTDLQKIFDLTAELQNGAKTVEDYKKALDGIANSTANRYARELAMDLQKAADELQPFRDRLKESADALRLVSSDSVVTRKEIGSLGAGFEGSARILEAQTAAAKEFADALHKIRAEIPGIKDVQKALDDAQKIMFTQDIAMQSAGMLSEADRAKRVPELNADAVAATSAINYKDILKNMSASGLPAGAVNGLKEELAKAVAAFLGQAISTEAYPEVSDLKITSGLTPYVERYQGGKFNKQPKNETALAVGAA